MSAGSGLPAEMRRLLSWLRDDPLALDDDSADRLLAGRLDPADAPPGYAETAAVMAAATAPARPDELAGMQALLDAFRAALDAPPQSPRRQRMLVRLLTVKALAAAFTGALLIGGVAAAATGSLPDAAQRMAHRIAGAAPAPAGDAEDHGRGDAGSAATASTHGQGQASGAGQASHDGTTGPDLSKIDKTGLCTAYLAGQGGTKGGKYDAAAFEALERAAGGADKVAAFCADVVKSQAGSGQGQGQQPTDPGSAADDHAQGQGQDQQPTDPGSAADDHGGGRP
jgi:hypothetical protein